MGSIRECRGVRHVLGAGRVCMCSGALGLLGGVGGIWGHWGPSGVVRGALGAGRSVGAQGPAGV